MASARELAVKRLATEARLDLSWLGGAYAALKLRQCHIREVTEGILKGKIDVMTRVPEVTEEEKRRFREAMALFREVTASSLDSPSDNVGHYLSKSAIVYAAAIVENFVKRAFEETFGKGPLDQCSSLNRYIEVITGKARGSPKRCLLFRRAKRSKKKYIAGFADGSEGVRFLAALRNVIVHSHGDVDGKDLKGFERLLDTMHNAEFPGGFKAEFLHECRNSGRVLLHVVKVVVPCVRNATDFVENAERKFVAAGP